MSDAPYPWPSKWVRIMCDFCADGIWDHEGAGQNISDLPVTQFLRDRILAWQVEYERGHDNSENQWSIGVDVEKFSAVGLEIARDVKRELPDWTVVYFDEAKSEKVPLDHGIKTPPRSIYEYEVIL